MSAFLAMCCGMGGDQRRPAFAASGVTLHVSPGGSDVGSGSEGQPLATLERARDVARKAESGKPPRIVVHSGSYYLASPLVLDSSDAGLVVEAATGDRAVLYGGRRISGWQPDGERFWAARLLEGGTQAWDFRMLVVNGRFCRRARLPKKGHFTHLSEFNVPWMSTTGGGWKRKPTTQEVTSMRYRPESLGAWLDVRNAELTVYHMWDESVVGLASHDPNGHVLTFSNPAGHPPGAFGVRKYVVWNVREGMNEPGQWYLDRTGGRVVYWPLPGEDMTRAEVVAPTIESIIELRGTSGPVRGITLDGLTLSVTHTPLKSGGFGAGAFAGALQIGRSENCRVVNLAIENVGGQGIREWGSKGLRIERCRIHHTGACGVKVGGGDAVVSDCRIHDVGITYPSAIGLWGEGHSPRGVHFVHNEIFNTPYTAVACGGNNNTVEANLIHDAMRELHDGAGIYITFCKGNTVRGNFIRDIIDTGGYGASAYYLDEQAEGCLVEGNLSLRVAHPSHNHMARKNTIANNVFVAEGDAKITFPKSSGFCFERNVVVAQGRIVLTNPEALTGFSDNVLFSRIGKVEGQALAGYTPATTSTRITGRAFDSSDPKLAEFEKGRVRFEPDSPAIRLGIRPIDVSGAGPR